MTINIGSPPSDLPATPEQLVAIRFDLQTPGFLGAVANSTLLDTLVTVGVVGDTARATDTGRIWELIATPANSLSNWRIRYVDPGNASQAEAEAGAEDTKHMTALRVAQAIDVQADPAGAAAAAQAAAIASGNAAASAAQAAAIASGNAAASAAQAAAIAASQPVDADLTAIAALSTTAYGRALLEKADGAVLTALLNLFTSALKGLVPASGGGTTNFLRADGSWAEPPGGAGGSGAGSIEVNGGGGGNDRTAVTYEADPVNDGYTRVKTETINGIPWTLQYDAQGKPTFREYVAGGLSVPITYNGAFGYVTSGNYTDCRGIRVTPAQATSLKTQLTSLGQAVQGLRLNVIGFESGGLGDVAVEWDAVTDAYFRISRASIAL